MSGWEFGFVGAVMGATFGVMVWAMAKMRLFVAVRRKWAKFILGNDTLDDDPGSA